ncbi:MAG: 3-methylcrotonyl-CoA carboxylase subunit alpha [Alphaproteobacteria bacterium]|nr:MAG: 3-methylcrotonyl-CoA carboxylase subunit alpha [Alphaproteobacteria bacterium]
MSRPIARLLVANRGEIASRLMRTARRMGIATVAVFSEADRDAPHVGMADEAVAIGQAPAEQSYLRIDTIVDAARRVGADAIHPGYGFLAENAGFAGACAAAGITFVGPSPEAIALMGDKSAARAKMVAAGVPVVPGFSGIDQDEASLARAAAAVGFPVLIKAATGGGGRGMRRVDGPDGFAAALASARREARAAFGDDTVLLEKYVAGARHVEIQIFGDCHGNCVHLFERDCSAQRRHQKIIEEAPSPAVDREMRTRLGRWAVAAARSVGYEGAGTVEFIVDEAGGAFFLEMNTRLQVEHPVTEMVTGIDLVEWQLRVAAGEPLPLAQEDIRLDGHAVEARLCAENPYDGFLPQTGTIRHFQPPVAGDGLRVDAGIAEGGTVSAHYDPMLAKFVAHGRDRAEAVSRLVRLIGETPIIGVPTNAGFLVRLLRSPEFAAGSLTTATVDDWIAGRNAILAAPQPAIDDFIAVAAAAALAPGGGWFRSTGVAQCPVPLVCGAHAETVRLTFERGRLALAEAGGQAAALDAASLAGDVLSISIGGHMRRSRIIAGADGYHLARDGEVLIFREPDPLAAAARAADPRRLVAPTSGRVARLAVGAGEAVAEGQTVAVIEAMKMETTLASVIAGVVAAVHAAEGDQVQAGDLIAEIEPEEA